MICFSFLDGYGQVIFEDDFSGAELKTEWTPRPNLSGSNGIIQLADNIGTGNSRAVLLGKSSDRGGFTTNALDLHLDLSNTPQVEMTFSVYDFYDENHVEDGLFFSDDGGLNFTKVFDFFPGEWCNERFGTFPQ